MQATPHVGAAACWVALALILAVSPYVSVTYECVPPAGKGEFPPPCAVETDEASTTVVLTTTWQATREYVKLVTPEEAVHGAAVRQLELVITLALNQLTVAAALVYWPKPVGKHGGYDEYGASATAAMMQKYGSV